MLTLPPASRPDGEGEEGAGETSGAAGATSGAAGALEEVRESDSGAEERQKRKTLMEVRPSGHDGTETGRDGDGNGNGNGNGTEMEMETEKTGY